MLSYNNLSAEHACTAVVLSPEPVDAVFPGWTTLGWSNKFLDTECPLSELHKHRLLSLQHVTTPYFAYIDSDDTLPDNTAEQMSRLLGMMQARDHAIGYTDGWIITKEGVLRDAPGEYEPVKYYTRLNYLHALVVMRTADAQALARTMPLGLYDTRYMLHAALARGGASYLPEIGHTWNEYTQGMHTNQRIHRAQQNARLWYLRSYPLLR